MPASTPTTEELKSPLAATKGLDYAVLATTDSSNVTSYPEIVKQVHAQSAFFEDAGQEGEAPAHDATKPTRYAPLSMRDLMAQEFIYDPILAGLLDKGESVTITATSGVGKSLFTTLLALELACRREYGFNKAFEIFFMPKRRNILFCQSENSSRATKARIEMMIKGKPRLETALDNIFFHRPNNEEVRVSGDFENSEFMAGLEADIISTQAEVLIIDPLISYHNNEENDNTGMRRALDCVTALQDRTKVAVALVHHTGKSGDLSGRGATAIRDWTGAILGIERVPTKDDVKLFMVSNLKNRNYEEYKPFYLSRDEHLIFRHEKMAVSSKMQEEAKKAADCLAGIGGRCVSAQELKNAIVTAHNVKDRTASAYIAAAITTNKIRHLPKEGKNQGYELSETYATGE